MIFTDVDVVTVDVVIVDVVMVDAGVVDFVVILARQRRTCAVQSSRPSTTLFGAPCWLVRSVVLLNASSLCSPAA